MAALKRRQRKNQSQNVPQLSFKERVLAVVERIPKGKTLTYGDVARLAGSPRATRAVGSIMAKNVNPRVPCHRVIRGDGALGGYNRGGEDKKRALLKKEGAL